MENFSSQAFAFHRLENANSQKKKSLLTHIQQYSKYVLTQIITSLSQESHI